MRNFVLKLLSRAFTKLTRLALNNISNDLALVEQILATTESAIYLKRMNGAKRFSKHVGFLEYCCNQSSSNGSVLEFGVYSGNSINILANSSRGKKIYGFDSFEGLPETWRHGFEKGVFDLRGNMPQVLENVTLIKGWFDQSLPRWKEENDEQISILHVDCDLYSSTKTIFSTLSERIKPGVIIIFDEYFNYPGWKDGEFKAFQEWCASEKKEYEYIAINMAHEQVAVRILK